MMVHLDQETLNPVIQQSVAEMVKVIPQYAILFPSTQVFMSSMLDSVTTETAGEER